MMPETTIDNKSFRITNTKAITALFIAISMTFSATKFWAKAERTASDLKYAKGAEQRRIANQAEREDYERKILRLEFENDMLKHKLENH